MHRSTSSTPPRVRINALLTHEEAETLRKLLGSLTSEACSNFTDDDDEASAFVAVATKLRRHLNAAEEIPQLPDFDD
ncbi:MAG: hypothetical protein AAFQ95_12210 [Cyanobacteria bacterium J06621_3]